MSFPRLTFLSKIHRRLSGPQATSYQMVAWFWPRLLALCFLVAFWSWSVQADGLVGSEGIIPAVSRLNYVEETAATEHLSVWANFPTVFLWGHADGTLVNVCWIGVLAAALAMAGICQGLMLFVCWALYLSIVKIGAIFMGFQWDALLLEAGVLGIFASSWKWWSPWLTEVTLCRKVAIWAGHFLLLKLLFLSGWVKLASMDELWLHDQALSVHYETQPLPTPLAWHAHHWPLWFQQLTCRAMFFVELVLPLAIYFGRRGRLVASTGISLLMVAVLFTGNYTYFNWLTIFLALSLLDDSWWPLGLKTKLTFVPPPPPVFVPKYQRWQMPTPVVKFWAQIRRSNPIWPSFILLLSVQTFLATLVRRQPSAEQALQLPLWFRAVGTAANILQPKWLVATLESIEKPLLPFQLVSSYGLFADMTDQRHEIVLEVSDNGTDWLEVPFRYKPGQANDTLHWVAPHQPRLDWQMWFAAFRPEFDPNRHMADPGINWLGNLMVRILQHKARVWRLLGPPPIPISSVTAVRAVIYRCQFTTPAERQETGKYWKRQILGQYTSSVSLHGE